MAEEYGNGISAASDKKDHDIFCSGAVVNYGSEIDGEIDAGEASNNRDQK